MYIIALPFFGIITEILPVFSRKPIFGYIGLVGATMLIGALSVAVWAHHMYVTGAVNLPFFSFMTFLIAVPTGVKFFNWVGTMWGGNIAMRTPMLWAVGFLTTFLFGGLTGVVLASPPLDFQLSDSYFVVAHFHYVVFGTVVFAMFAGFYFWWPKFTGQMLDETLGKVHFWLLFIGFHTTFLVQHWLGVEGMPRRYADYLPHEGFTVLNQVSSAGAFLLGGSTLVFIYNVWKSRNNPKVNSDDPWGWGRSLEWATSCPPPRHNFTSIPRIRSESPAFDLHHPEVALAEYDDSGTDGSFDDTAVDAGEDTGRIGELKARVAGRVRRSGCRLREGPSGPVAVSRGGPEVRVEAWIFGSLTIFFALVTPAYCADHHGRERHPGDHRDRRPDPDLLPVLHDLRLPRSWCRGGSIRGPRTRRSGRSLKAPVNWASSRRTASGRSSCR